MVESSPMHSGSWFSSEEEDEGEEELQGDSVSRECLNDVYGEERDPARSLRTPRGPAGSQGSQSGRSTPVRRFERLSASDASLRSPHSSGAHTARSGALSARGPRSSMETKRLSGVAFGGSSNTGRQPRPSPSRHQPDMERRAESAPRSATKRSTVSGTSFADFGASARKSRESGSFLSPRPGRSRQSLPAAHAPNFALSFKPPPDRVRGDVSVCVRLRPGPRHEMCTFAENANCVRIRARSIAGGGPASGSQAGEAIYWCDQAFNPEATQESVYEQAVAPICGAVLEGYNGAVIAYGQTGSGKTHTIVGSEDNQGVIPRAVATIFAALQVRKHWSVEVSVLEIYNERTRDLLAPGQAVTQVDIHEMLDAQGVASGFQCPDATRLNVKNPQAALAALSEGLAKRETARTDMNHTSSRSHLIFTLTAVQSDDDLHARIHGRLHLVDLAGSERLKRSMASVGFGSARPSFGGGSPDGRDQRKEAGAINKSLTQLALVIYRLTQGGGGGVQHVPYRDSMLTRLLADSFGGNSKTCLIITCSPLVKDRDETKGALEFGKRANLVRNVAEINIEMQQEMSDVVKALVAKELADMKKEQEVFKRKLAEAAAAALAQQKLRAEEVRRLEDEKGVLERHWVEAAISAEEIQAEATAQIATLHERLEGMSRQLLQEQKQKATLQTLMQDMLATATASQVEETLARTREECSTMAAKSAERSETLRQAVDYASAEAERQAMLRPQRLAGFDEEALEMHERWKDHVRQPDPGSSTCTPVAGSGTEASWDGLGLSDVGCNESLANTLRETLATPDADGLEPSSPTGSPQARMLDPDDMPLEDELESASAVLLHGDPHSLSRPFDPPQRLPPGSIDLPHRLPPRVDPRAMLDSSANGLVEHYRC